MYIMYGVGKARDDEWDNPLIDLVGWCFCGGRGSFLCVSKKKRRRPS